VAERKVEFYLTALGTIALVRDRVSDMPYKHWSLRAVRALPSIIDSDSEASSYEQHTRFSVWTKTYAVVIDIVGSFCRLVSPDDASTSDILGRDMTPGALCATLQRRGINIMPTEKDIARALRDSGVVKDAELEDAVMKEMARLANAVDFEGSSDWNSSLKSSQIGVLAQESTVFTCNEESFDLECVLVERDDSSESHLSAPNVGTLPAPGARFTLVLGNEYGTKTSFSLLPRPNEVAHAALNSALSSRTTTECCERIERARTTFGYCVYTLLRTVRPLSLCIESAMPPIDPEVL
jgi:hypothetical protein